MDMEWPTKIHNPYGLWIFYGFFMNFQSKSVWIMDLLWIFNLNPYGLCIFMDFKSIMDYGFFMEWIWI